jgi:hypothetical protein
LDTAGLIDGAAGPPQSAPLSHILAYQSPLEAMPMPSTAKKRKVKKVMHEYKRAKPKSGSGRKVKSRKQAVAIAMSESGQSNRRKKAS